jgi:hypothetical protein
MNAKTTATELPTASNDQKPAAHFATSATPQVGAVASPGAAGAIKNASTPISSTPPADATVNAGKRDANASPAVKAEKLKAITKMEMASAIYLRMSIQKDVTRKQIVEQFVVEAKLSPAGASTYYQLIKAKLGR